MRPGVYSITCKVSNQCYVGSTKNLARRLQHHRQHLRRGDHGNSVLQKAYNEYGEHEFSVTIELFCAEDELLMKEQEVFDTKSKAFQMFNKGVNVADPLRGSKRPDRERAIQQLDNVRNKANIAFRNKLKTDVTFREKMQRVGRESMALLRTRPDVEAKRKQRAAEAQRRPEVQAKRSKEMKRRWAQGVYKNPDPSRFYKRVVNIETGEVFESLTKAAEVLCVSVPAMHRKVVGRKRNGVFKKAEADWKWQYEETNI